MLPAMRGIARLPFDVGSLKLKQLAPLCALLALAGCIPATTGPGPATHSPYSPNDGNVRDRGGNGGSSGDM
jgi:hypothetical protein